MAFVNIPPNFQDMFYNITDRIMKLETGPNQAMEYAEVAQAQATASELLAIAAGVEANNAAAQAVIAQSQATIASSQATAAQTSANGKNKNYYSTSGPGSTANIAGDLWFQYGVSAPYTNKVIAQFVGQGGTTWASMPISGLVVTNLDAGSITTGTLSAIQISAGSGANSFNVSSTGVMSAQGVYVKGAIVADSGTFTGSIRADAGYFGTGSGGTLLNGWSITGTGLTAVGTGNLTGGLITGATFQTSTGTEAVIMNGAQNAIQFKAAGSVVANMVPLVSAGSVYGLLMHYGATADPSGATRPQIYIGSGNLSLFAASNIGIGISTGIGITMNGGSAGTSISNPLDVNGTMRYPGIATGAGSTMVVVTTGSRVAYVTSSERFKQDISYITSDGWLDKVLAMKPITYKTSEDFTTEGEPNETQIGLLAEDIYDLGGGLETSVILDPLGDPFSLSYDRLTVFLTLAIKELKAEIDKLKGA